MVVSHDHTNYFTGKLSQLPQKPLKFLPQITCNIWYTPAKRLKYGFSGIEYLINSNTAARSLTDKYAQCLRQSVDISVKPQARPPYVTTFMQPFLKHHALLCTALLIATKI